MSEYKETWQVGDMAWIHTDFQYLSRGDIVKVRYIDNVGRPCRGYAGASEILNAYRVLRQGEKVPDGTVLVRVGNWWARQSTRTSYNDGSEAVAGVDIGSPRHGIWAIKSMPTEDPEREERLKRIENMERELAELKKLEENQ